MDHFIYKNGRLFAENVNIDKIAEAVGTPVYIYSKATFIDHLQKIQKAYSELDTLICYSVKACGNINILKFMAELGSGFDVVSGGELFRALQAGSKPSKIVFAGVGKTDAEIIEALDAAGRIKDFTGQFVYGITFRSAFAIDNEGLTRTACPGG